ncbi:hypothetical protein PSMK_01100 [Phycisphaera mikurensis NBRC 102666]|uniref:Heme-binding protein n=1 Tax=Phycisphaera mikurensis (strain NBRC 102666 / KCTC 22515 / FYK2301M01) TaxID=1142394 RepID=I0IAI1_PHYMF|nr:heme-binding protein [Phycisphaera mikurensis]MBB6441734.1 uncharacterized protein GlcG (DUF336 family) [Phycisphaera mikurensis]BAM02269.1 hypothetical protein PSMK_01100 [Phycisphaera mikurensis NBRC 102666]
MNTRLLLLAALAASASFAAPAAPALADHHREAGDPPLAAASVGTLDLATAYVAVKAAIEKCEQMGVKMNIAVVDAGANLVAFARMDGAWLGSTDIAVRKAKTARFFDMPTGDIGELSQPGGPLYEIESSNGGLITFPGGVPIRNADGAVIGAIGVSGSTVEDDHEVAMAGLGAVQPEQPEDGG